MTDHSGAVAIVTGASRGIGLAIAKRLVDEGAQVVITARKAEPLADAVAQLGEANAVGVAGNSSDEAHQHQVVATAVERFASLTYLVNNTGINPHYGPMLDSGPEVARKVLDANVVSAASWVRRAIDAGLGSGDRQGAVVNVGSIAAFGASAVRNIELVTAVAANAVHMT